MAQAMIVDDSRAIRMILRKTLERLGYDVVQAANGKEALDQLQTGSDVVSLCLVDWNMPEMDGLDFVKNLRSNPRFQSVLVMMVTTETEADHISMALEAGANEYVIKPFTDEIIEDKLRLLGALA